MATGTSKTEKQIEMIEWKQTEQYIQEQWNNFKSWNRCVMDIPEEEKEKRTRYIFDSVMTANFAHQIQETQRMSSRIHSILKLKKVKVKK